MVLATTGAAALAGCMGDLTEEDYTDTAQTAVSSEPIPVVRRGSNKCVDVYAAATADGTRIQQYSCNGTPAQLFKFEDRGGGYFRIRNPNSNRCLDVAAAGTANGSKVHLWGCHDGGNQKWRIDDVGGGWARLVGQASGRCLDVSAGSSADSVQLQIWDCNSGDAQAWRLSGGSTPPPPPPPPPPDGLVWRRANLTNYTSWPDPGSDECRYYNGCTWAGYFAFVDGQKDENWVRARNIAAVHSRDAQALKLKTLRIKQGGRQIDAVVYDMCSDSDCNGCCTNNANANGVGFLIDIEKYTMERFGSGHGIVDWACLDCR